MCDDREARAKAAREFADERPNHLQWGDREIAATASWILAWHEVDPGFKIKLAIEKGWITLTGHVDWAFQKEAVDQDVRRLLGVVGVTNHITTERPSAASTPGHATQFAFATS